MPAMPPNTSPLPPPTCVPPMAAAPAPAPIRPPMREEPPAIRQLPRGWEWTAAMDGNDAG